MTHDYKKDYLYAIKMERNRLKDKLAMEFYGCDAITEVEFTNRILEIDRTYDTLFLILRK